MITPDHLLSPTEFEVLWHHFRLGRMPYPIDVPSSGDTEQDHLTLQNRTLDVLRERGLLTDQRLEGFMRLFGDHETSIDAVASLGRPVRALAVAKGEQGVLAIIDGDRVGLAEVRSTGLAHETVQVLSDGEPGPGNALSVRLEDLQHAVTLQKEAPDEDDSGSPWGTAEELDEKQALRRAGLSSQDATAIGALAAGRVTGGQFGVTRGKHRSDVVVNWFDTHQGRYLMVNSGGWLSISPTDNDRIATRINALLV